MVLQLVPQLVQWFEAQEQLPVELLEEPSQADLWTGFFLSLNKQLVAKISRWKFLVQSEGRGTSSRVNYWVQSSA